MTRKKTIEENLAVSKSSAKVPKEKVRSMTYSEVSSQVKAESLDRAICFHMRCYEHGQLRDKPIPWDDVKAMKKLVFEFLQICQDEQTLPSIEKLCLYMGIDRSRWYQVVKQETRVEAREFLQSVSGLFSSILIDQASQRNVSEVLSIFLLKNYGYADKVQIEAITDPIHQTPTDEELIQNASLLP